MTPISSSLTRTTEHIAGIIRTIIALTIVRLIRRLESTGPTTINDMFHRQVKWRYVPPLSVQHVDFAMFSNIKELI